MDLYFQRHDGQAVTCDDFVQAMQDASGVDLDAVQALVRRGRHAGARLRTAFDTQTGSSACTVKQSMNPPFHIPFAREDRRSTSRCCRSRSREETFTFEVKCEAGAVAAAQLLGAGDPELRYSEQRPASTCWRTTTTRSTAGKRGSGSPRRSILRGDRASPRRRSSAAARRACCEIRDPAFAAEALTPAGRNLPRRAARGGRSRRAARRRATRCAASSARTLERTDFRRLPGPEHARAPTRPTPSRSAGARCATCACPISSKLGHSALRRTSSSAPPTT